MDIAEFLKIILTVFNAGFFFTAGMWAFCKITRWAPVNITTVIHSTRED